MRPRRIETPKPSEGLSFKPVLEGKQDTVREVLYGAYCGGTKPGMRCVKQGDWKLIKYDLMNGDVRETQLFNLKDNPLEFIGEHDTPQVRNLAGAKPAARQTNLAENPKHAAKLAEMEAPPPRRDATTRRSLPPLEPADEGLKTLPANQKKPNTLRKKRNQPKEPAETKPTTS